MCSTDQDKEKAWLSKMQIGEQRKMKGVKWSGARTLGQERNDYPQKDFRTCTISIPVPQQKTKVHFCWLTSGFSLHVLSHEIKLFHSDKHDRTIAIPSQVSPALASCVNTSKALLNSQCPESFPLAFSRRPQITPQGFRYITLPVEAPNPYIIQPVEPNNGETYSTML